MEEQNTQSISTNQHQELIEQSESQIDQPSEQAETKQSLADLIRTDENVKREFDKRITQAINTAKAKWDEEAKLTDDERAAKALADREQALSEKEAAFTLKERTAETKLKLIDKGLPVCLSELIAEGTNTDEEANDLIASIESEWNSQMTEKIKAGARQVPATASQETSLDEAGGRTGLAEFAAKNRKVK